ncbi:MAG: CpsB/CapC family capsule biosynthesis tyrosine phosphatase [Agathobacter sp.]
MKGIIDIHCHVLHGVDDGVQTIEEAEQFFRQMAAEGIAGVILTPHYRKGMFETPQSVMAERYRQLYPVAKAAGVIALPGCEYHVDQQMLENISQKRRWTLAGSSYVLTEYSGADDYDYIKGNTYELLSAGYIPVLAHIERIRCLNSDIGALEELSDMGARIQVNADAVLGIEGGTSKRFCRKLLKEDLIDFIASDCHGLKRRPSHLAECADYVERKYGHQLAKKIFLDNPREILRSINR